MASRRTELETIPQDYSVYSEWAGPSSDGEERSTAAEGYRRYTLPKIAFIVVAVLATLVVMGVAIAIGEYPIGVLESYQIIFDHIARSVNGLLGNDVPELDRVADIKDHVVCDLRMPRIAAGIVAGAALAVAGTAMQSTLKNPLADPYTTGISSGACFGATLAICYGHGLLASDGSIVMSAFVFSLIPTAMIISISMIKKVSPVSMILAGIAVMYIFNAFSTVMRLWADPNDLEAVYLWQVGSLDSIRWDDLPVMLVVTVAGSIAIMVLSRDLNILSSGDESARSLGLNASTMRIVLLIIVSLMAASIVSYTGIIGFVGLVAPHVCRMFVGADNRYLVPASAAIGALLLVVSDLIGRTVIAPSELQVGVVTSFIGGPLFLYLIIRQRKEVWG